jgi:hypothetical protein
MDILAYPKKHPWVTGIVIVIGGIVFITISGVFSGSGGGGSATSSGGGLSDAELAAQAQITAATIAAQAQAAQAGAALQAAQIGAGVQVNSDNLNAQVAMRQLDVNRELGLSEIESNRQVSLASTNAQVEGLRIQTMGQVETNRIIASGQASAARSSSRSSTVSSILGFAGTALAFFSDERLKENVKRIGTTEAGYGVYEFNYKGDNRRYRGVVAQEVRQYRPDLVIEDKRTGHLKVLPQALAA